MWYFVIKAVISGILIALISSVAKRYPAMGALITALPLIAIMAMIWLWRDETASSDLATYAESTFWYVLPSLPMFLLIPSMLRHGAGFLLSLLAGCLLTIALYLLLVWAGPKLGLRI